MPPLRRKHKPRPKPKPALSKAEQAYEANLALYSLRGASLESLLHTMQLLRLDSPPADDFVSLQERKERAQRNVERGYDSSQRLKSLFPGLPLRDRKPTLSFADLDVWPEWEKPHLADMDSSYKQDIPGHREHAYLRSSAGLGVKSIGRAFSKGRSINDLLRNAATGIAGVEGDDWAETKKAFENLAFLVDGFGPAMKICEERLAIEVVDVRKVFPAELRKPAVIPEAVEAVPVVVVRYMMGTPPSSSEEITRVWPAVHYLGTSPSRKKSVQYCSTASQTLQIVSLLIHNSSLLSPDYVTEMKKTLPDDVKPFFGVSFFVPLHSVEFKESSKIAKPAELGVRCALPACDKAGAKMICSRCKSVQYCDSEHSTEDWATHKFSCLRRKYPDLFAKRAADRGRVLVPLINMADRFTTSMTNLQSDQSTSFDTGIISRNIHGTGSFLVKVQRDGGGNIKEFGGDAGIYDRERSFVISYGSKRPTPKSSAADLAEFASYKRLDECILACARWKGDKAYLKAYRVGDQIEIDLDDLPSQEQTW